MSELVAIQDRTRRGTLTAQDLEDCAVAMNHQAAFDYGRSPWVERGYSSPATVVLVHENGIVPQGAWVIELLETSDQPGALGYHENRAFDNTGAGLKKATGRSSRGLATTGVPLAKVFVKTCQEDGVPFTEVVSHELLEMLVDPMVANGGRTVEHDGKLWIVEVCDPVQGNGYQVPGTDVTVADFCYPKWFGMAQTRTELSFRNSVQAPFELAPQGYISTAPAREPSNWTQTFGSSA